MSTSLGSAHLVKKLHWYSVYYARLNTLQAQKLCMWTADNLAHLHMSFLAIVAGYNNPKKPKNHSSYFVYYYVAIYKNGIIYLEK